MSVFHLLASATSATFLVPNSKSFDLARFGKIGVPAALPQRLLKRNYLFIADAASASFFIAQ